MSTPTNNTIVQGTVLSGNDPEMLRAALDAAFEYRGDVTIRRHDDSEVSGYLFDRRSELTLEQSFVRVLEVDAEDPVAIHYLEIAEVRFSGRDTAIGKSWENWLHRYAEKKIAGNNAGTNLKNDS